MFLTKGCPRCHGDLYQDRDQDGYYLNCLQCGQEIQLTRQLASGESLTLDAVDPVQADINAELSPAASHPGRNGSHRKILRVA